MVTICETELMHKLADPTRHAMFLVSVLNVIEPGNVQLHRLGISTLLLYQREYTSMCMCYVVYMCHHVFAKCSA